LDQLRKVALQRAGLSPADRKAVKDVVGKLIRLVKTARKINKPIAF